MDMEIARVDLREVVPGGAGWEAARAAVTASMVAHGCVVVAHDALCADLRQALFSCALPELYALPLEVKQRMVSDNWVFKGYIGQRPGMYWESLRVEEPTNAASVSGFAKIIWPEGNLKFCETIMSFANSMKKLVEMVETLVLEGLGARAESIDKHFDLLAGPGVRLLHYNVPLDTENSISMPPHLDYSMVTAIVQHEVAGLEVHVGDGSWVAIPAENNTITIIAGEQLTVVTNGRVPACLHRVRTQSNRKRFSVLFGRRHKEDIAVRAMEDLVDAAHPLVYNPLHHDEYSKWRFSEEGIKCSDPLKFYCGVDKDKVVGAMA